ncbi:MULTISPECIES: alpha-amylase family glycosyl hydrolase [unclassified Caulobacter]|uniref:alpha-amylase family glycosyl hydrolase n=1 Tax=unclassified Caulobacter TaxID=2648921 RepID=UPI000D3840A5|nr:MULTISPECIES: alpha-amylase family glycosyl hydrolase [unclassified Caulobacter]PTS88682.1 alpha-amylase [Caulobacter sp. HMWF009]PTT05186.1 alpha-amylase [Caulobacter sp. HMWF025]
MSARVSWKRALMAMTAFGVLAAVSGKALADGADASFRLRQARDEVIYFVLPDRFANGDATNDRGGLKGGRLETGFDPTHAGFYHGGDLKGLTERLDYIQGLGATAIWVGPIFRNKAVQGAPGHESAAHHGYWITDFTDVDPHFGTRAEFKTFVDSAHARGMKVYLDIVANHTADVIRYRECPANDCGYRSKADFPYSRRGGLSGAPINPAFDGRDFGRVTRFDHSYSPYVPAGEETVKKPAWLNDPTFYHNRGDSTFAGESSLLGDFAGLDDLFTENPRVVQGFIDIYGQWIDDFGIDGYRIDTARHVNPEFWQAFIPAMQARARAKGIENFHIFGEVFDTDVATLARHTKVDGFPAVLDFAFQSTVTDMIAGKAGTDRLARVFAGDVLYEGGATAALQLPTFLGNHDMGRFGYFLLKANPALSDGELLSRMTLGHALMMFSRGVPTIYYGDEQGFTGDGDYADSREDMFASQVARYRDNRLIGVQGTPDGDHYRTDGPLYRSIADMARIRGANAALRSGRQVVRAQSERPGLLAFSRLGEQREYLVVFNTGLTPIAAQVEVETTSGTWRSIRGTCAGAASAPGSYRVEIGPLDYMICVSEGLQ